MTLLKFYLERDSRVLALEETNIMPTSRLDKSMQESSGETTWYGEGLIEKEG